MKKENWFLSVLIILVLFLIIWEPQFGWRIQDFLRVAIIRIPEASDELRLENSALKAEIAKLEDIKNQLPAGNADGINAQVYSRYPFNFKSEILLNVGSAHGVVENSPVVFGGFLVGKIQKVFGDYSLARTIFDFNWRSEVRIGKAGLDGLFIGGSNPKITLIDKQLDINVGDPVYSASPDFPYGLPVGEIKNYGLSTDQLYKEAELVFPYKLKDIRNVIILKNVNGSN